MSGFLKLAKSAADKVSSALDFNAATLSGAIDVIVVEQEDGTLLSTPFHVRFGKLQLLRSKEKMVSISVNGETTDLIMKLGAAGEAFFIEETSDDVPQDLITSPIGSPSLSPEMEGQLPPDLSLGDHEEGEVLTEKLVALNEEREKQEKLTTEAVEQLDEANEENFDDALDDTFDADQARTRWSWGWGTLPVETDNVSNPSQSHSASRAPSEPSSAPQSPDRPTPKLLDTKEVEPASTSNERPPPSPTLHQGLHDDSAAATPNSIKPSELLPATHKTVEFSAEADEEIEVAARARSETDATDETFHTSYHSRQGSIIPRVDSTASMGSVFANYTFSMALCGHLLEQNGEKKANLSEEEVDAMFDKYLVTYEEFCKDPSILQSSEAVFRVGKSTKLYPWEVAAPMITSLMVFGEHLPDSVVEQLVENFSKSKTSEGEKQSWWRFWKSPQSVPSVPPDSGSLASLSPLASPPMEGKDPSVKATPAENGDAPKPMRFRKTVRPSSDQLRALNLNDNVNTVTFTVSSKLQGTQSVSARVFKWNTHDKIIISDIDGTITRSDVLGQLLPVLGKDWSHSGVTALYSNIMQNGYKILYLTSRAIGQANQTRDYLQSVEQEGEKLPDGPVVMSPDRLFHSFKREVILRRPEEFKIACLRDIQKLWPEGKTPFYAGFGNRNTDAKSYEAVDIPYSKIFIINPSGEVRTQFQGYVKSYPSMNEIVHLMFPGVKSDSVEEEFNSWNYWRTPLTGIVALEDEDDQLEAPV